MEGGEGRAWSRRLLDGVALQERAAVPSLEGIYECAEDDGVAVWHSAILTRRPEPEEGKILPGCGHPAAAS